MKHAPLNHVLPLILALVLGSWGAARTYGRAAYVEHVPETLSTTIDKTWKKLRAAGYSSTVYAMSRTSVTYRFSRGIERLEVTFTQNAEGVLVMSQDTTPQVLALRP